MQKGNVDVTHTIVHRVAVRARTEVDAHVRAVEVVKDEGRLSDDADTPAEIRNTFATATVK